MTIDDAEDTTALALKVAGDAWPTAIAEGGTAALVFTLDLPTGTVLGRNVTFKIKDFAVHKRSDNSVVSGATPTFSAGGGAWNASSGILTFFNPRGSSLTARDETVTLTLAVPNDDLAALYDVRFQVEAVATNALSAATSLTDPVDAAAKINITNDDTVALSFEGVPASVAEGAVANTGYAVEVESCGGGRFTRHHEA